MPSLILAFDRSARSFDADGRLHVAVSHISKATVNPYYGNEIPGYEELGLNPTQIYNLLRDPEELAKGAATFNNLPILSRHIPVSAAAPQKDSVCGSTGTDAVFNAPYLDNSLVIWDAEMIAAIESQDQAQLSSAYRYRPDMTPGVYEGVPYDGIMRDIVGNHVALVETGRAGSDVVVADANPFFTEAANMKASGKTVAVRAALRAVLRPMMAADSALDINALVGKVTGKTIKQDATRIAKAIKAKGIAMDEDTIKQTVEEAAKDESEEEAHAKEVLGGEKANRELDKEREEGEDGTDPEDGYIIDRIVKVLEGAGVPADVIEAVRTAGKKPNEDESEEEKHRREVEGGEKANRELDKERPDREGEKKAMDAAIRNAEMRAVERFNAIRRAEKEVAPIIGEVAAMDSADSIYKMALDAMGVDVHGVPASAYGALVRELSKAKAASPRIAQDAAAAAGDFFDQFPNLDKAKLPRRA